MTRGKIHPIAKADGLSFAIIVRDRNRHFSKRWLNNRNFLALLSKQYREDLKIWQNLEPHYTDLLDEQVKTKREMDYLQSVANFGHTKVRNIYLWFMPLNTVLFIALCTITPEALNIFYVENVNLFRAVVWFPLAIGITNVPLAIYLRRKWHDYTYRHIQDKLGLTIFKYFEIVEKDKHIDGGYTKKDIAAILKRFNPKMPYTQDEIATYLQGILEIEMEKKPRGVVYYLFLKEKYFDKYEEMRQTAQPNEL